MRRIYTSSAIVILVLLCSIDSGFSQPVMRRDTSFRNDPAAELLFKQLRRSMRRLQTFAFNSTYSTSLKTAEPRPVAHYSMWMKKPNLFRMEGLDSLGRLTGVLLHDGQSLWEYWPGIRPRWVSEDSIAHARTSTHRYMQRSRPAKDVSIKKEAGFLGNGMIWAILDLAVFFEDSSAENEPTALKYDGTMMRGTTTIDGEPCTIIERSFNDRYYRQTIWISQRDFVPRKLREDIAQVIMIEEWTDIKMNEPISDARFVWQPPEGWQPWFRPAKELRLPEKSSLIPDFSMQSTKGERIVLSQLRGKIVVLNEWGLNCPPCRAQIPQLQKLYETYRRKGVIVIGMNCGDSQEFTEKFLAQNRITYPNVLATAHADIEFIRTAINPTGSEPVTLIIDREGKVADSFIGYEAGDNRVEEAVRRLCAK